MDEREIQKILYGFSGGFLLAGVLMISLGNSGFSITIFGFTVLLIGMASVGPSTIKTWGAKWGSDGGQIGFERYQPTEEDRELTLKLAQDNPSPEIEKKGEELIEEAEERTPEKRSPEDYLALATEKWRAKDYDNALADVFAGLALNPKDVRVKASLIARKATIYHFTGLRDFGVKFHKEAIALDPGFSWPHNNLGALYYDEGKLEKAKKEFEEALRLDPDDNTAKENIELLKRKMEKGK